MGWYPKYIDKCKKIFIEYHLLCRENVKWENTQPSARLCKKKQRLSKPETIETGYLEMIGTNGVEKVGLVGIGWNGWKWGLGVTPLWVYFFVVVTFRTILLFLTLNKETSKQTDKNEKTKMKTKTKIKEFICISNKQYNHT